jgi:hypothetical protein
MNIFLKILCLSLLTIIRIHALKAEEQELFEAIKEGNKDKVALLISTKKVDVNIADEDGTTPLRGSCFFPENRYYKIIDQTWIRANCKR